MKTLFTLIAFLAINFTLFSQAPQRLSYQAVIRNSTGGLVTSHAVGIKISILQESATGTAVYVETHTTTTNANGLATVQIGGGSVVSGTFATINWASGTYYLKTEADPAGGSIYTIEGTSQLLSVPYALSSKISESVADNSITSAKIIDASIVTADLADHTVSTAKLGNLAVSADKIQNGAVITDKLAGGSVTGAKIAQAGATSGQVLKWNGTTWLPAVDAIALPYSGTGTSGSPLFNITNLGTSGAISTFSSGNYGIWGESGGLSGIGVYGVNKLTSGNTYGVFGDVYSPSGFSGFFQGGKFYIQGNTGIGTQNPQGIMEIYGNSVDSYPTLLLSEEDGYSRVSFRTMSASAKHWVLAGHTNANDGDSQFHLNYNNGTTGKNIFSVFGNSRISFDGKVGIGNIDPEALLQVHSNITYSTGITPIFKISDNIKTWNIGLGASGDRFSIASEDLTERLTILKSNGNVGIGTTSPGSKLEVAGQVKIAGGSPGSGKVLTSDATGLASWQAPQPVTWLKNGGDIYYNSGYVAIGTTFPRYRLTIYDDSDSWIGFYNSTSGTTGTDGFTIGTSAAGSAVWIWNCENSNMHFGTNNDNRMIINADGHISMMSYLDLNTESTFGALYVKGKQALWWDGTYFSWGYDATYNYFARPVTIGDPANHTSYMLYVKGNAYTTGSWGSSDMRFKKNISSIDNSLHRVMKVQGVSFEFRNDEFRDYQFAEGKQFGFIAQELEKEFPEVVKTESDGYKSVNYNGMIPVLLEAVKEQQKMIDRLRTDNENLNTRLEKLEKTFSVNASNNE